MFYKYLFLAFFSLTGTAYVLPANPTPNDSTDEIDWDVNCDQELKAPKELHHKKKPHSIRSIVLSSIGIGSAALLGLGYIGMQNFSSEQKKPVQSTSPVALTDEEKAIFLTIINPNYQECVYIEKNLTPRLCQYKFNPKDFINIDPKLAHGGNLLHYVIRNEYLHDKLSFEEFSFGSYWFIKKFLYMFICYGGNINETDNEGNTPLDLMCKLKKTSPNFNVYKNTMLLLGGYITMALEIETLNFKERDLNKFNSLDATFYNSYTQLWRKKDGYQTWLHWYLNQPNVTEEKIKEVIDIIKIFVEYIGYTYKYYLRVYLNIQDKNGQTALDLANPSQSIYNILEEAMADEKICNPPQKPEGSPDDSSSESED